MRQEKVTLRGAQETTVATVYGKALDNRSANPILRDHVADAAVRRMDYDFRRTGINAVSAAGVALRAKVLDDWVREFLAEHTEATVLNLACGLDPRVHRIDPSGGVRWVDVDFPDVLDLRGRLLPERSGDYRTIGSSVTEDGWLREVPDDRPTAAVFEGLTMYLSEMDGKALLQRLAGRFPTMTAVKDTAVNWVTIGAMATSTALSIAGGEEIVAHVSGDDD